MARALSKVTVYCLERWVVKFAGEQRLHNSCRILTGTGDGALTYSVAANAGGTIRSDTLTIGGHTFTVYQGFEFLDVPSNNPFY